MWLMMYCIIDVPASVYLNVLTHTDLDAKVNGGHVSVTVTSHMRLKQLNVVGRTCSFTKSAPNFSIDPYLCILLCVQAWRQEKNE